MSDEAIKTGSVVRLKAGGPAMTVETTEEAGTIGRAIGCVWFSQDGDLCQNCFAWTA
jgi:uncharacterized protein YodC (DUF2158 family)